MLWELFAYLRDRGSSAARELGLDREAISIDFRHRRCAAAWRPHLEAVRACLLDAAKAAPGRDTAVILGSGSCLDVPVAALADAFATVVLVDAHHPRPARALARQYPNVRLESADVTGLAAQARRAARGRAPLPSPAAHEVPLAGLRPDFTASVNLASQLPIPFYGILGRRLSQEDLSAFGRGLIESHLAWLGSLPGRVCLICDIAWQRADDTGVTQSRNALEGLVLPPPDRSWTWNIAPRPEESPAYDRQNQVAAYLDFGATAKAMPAGRTPAPPEWPLNA